MSDILFIDLLLCCMAFLWPVLASRRGRPRIISDGNYERAAADAQSQYEKRYALVKSYRWIAPVLAVYVLVRAFLETGAGESANTASLPNSLGVLLICFFAGAIIGVSLRYRGELDFAAAHPEFRDSIQPLVIRVGSLAAAGLAMGVMVLGLNIHNSVIGIPIIASALIIVFVGRRIVLAAMMRAQIREPEDSPFWLRVAGLVETFGFKPKQMVVWPNLIANGWALPNGTVAITSSLRKICTEEEVLAILAHELSHARDRDTVRIRRARLLCALLFGLPFMVVSFILGFVQAPEIFIMPALVLSAISFSLPASYVMARLTHRLEFKCDSDVSRIGLGRELASGLRKLHAFMGLPLKFIRGDRSLLSHPSTDLRIAALDVDPSQPEPV